MIANFLEHNVRICVSMLFPESDYHLNIFYMLNIHLLSCWRKCQNTFFEKSWLLFVLDAQKYIRPSLTKPTIGHFCLRSSSLDWNHNVTMISNAKGASTDVSDGRFCQIGSYILYLLIDVEFLHLDYFCTELLELLQNLLSNKWTRSPNFFFLLMNWLTRLHYQQKRLK